MMRPAGEVAVYVCREAVDFRKSIDGLSALVTHTLGKDPFAAQLYVFANRRRDKVKILYWERCGFVVWYKRLEEARFPWPRSGTEPGIELTGRELNWLLDGIDVFALAPHAELSYETVL
jgi:transposase